MTRIVTGAYVTPGTACLIAHWQPLRKPQERNGRPGERRVGIHLDG